MILRLQEKEYAFNLQKQILKNWKNYKNIYTKQRYKDSAVYTDKVNLWKSKFEEHLKKREDSNPKRAVAIVMAVMTPNFDEDISLQELLDASYIRSKLDAFKLNKNTNSISKLYIKYLELIIKYLCTDVSSPEYVDNQTNDRLITQDIRPSATK